MTCPKCEAEMTDFREQKASGTKPPKFPDFKCEACGHPKWTTPKPRPAPTPRPAAGPGLPVDRSPKWTWGALSQTYQQSMIVARKSVIGMGAVLKMDVTMEHLLSATACIFIEACRSGVKLELPKPEPEPEDAGV